MGKFTVVVLACILTFCVGGIADAATYYVDSAAFNASDSNSGTAQMPWKHCPGVSGWTGSAVLRAGDVVLFNNTSTWTGSSGNALLEVTGGVTYDGRSWGAGTRATLKATGSFTRAIVSFRADHPSLPTVVKGFNIDGNGTSNSGVTVNWPASTNLIGATKRLEDSDIHDLRPVLGGAARYGIKVGAIAGDTCKNVEIIDTKVHDINTSGITIYAAVNCPTCLLENIVIRGCTVGPRILQYDTWNGTGVLFKNPQNNVLMEQTEIYDSILNNVIIQDDGSGAPQNLTIRNNLIHDSPRHGITVQTANTTQFDIYGNVIYGNVKNGIEFASTFAGSGNRVRLDNNTLYQNALGDLNFSSSGATFSQLEIKNNILSSRSDQVPMKISKSGWVTGHSNNVFYRPGGGTLASIGGVSYASSNLSSYESSALTADPKLASPSSGMFALATGSPAIGKGVNLGLSVFHPATVWPDQIQVLVQDAATGFDVGAYAYGIPESTTPTPVSGWVSSGIWQNEAIAEQSGVFMASFDAIPLGNNIDGVTAFSGFPMQGYADGAALIVFSKDGTIAARNGGAYAADVVVPYAAGQNYHIRAKFDIAHHVYDVWVTPSGGAEVQIAAGYAFRTEQANVSVLKNIGIVASTEATTGAHAISNLSVVTIPNVYAITVTAGAGGSVSPGGPVTLNEGASQAFAISPSAGYQVLDVKVDGTSVGAVSSYTFSGVTANHSIAASFAAIPVPTPTPSPTPTVSPSPSPTDRTGKGNKGHIRPSGGSK